MDEIVKQVSQHTGLSNDQARQVAQMVVEHLKARLPAPLASQVDTVLEGNTLTDAASQAKQLLGGMLGKQD